MKRVVIVGGGVIGLFCAVRLAKAGARVTLLEAEGEHYEVLGPGASAAAAGMLEPLGETASPRDELAFDSFDLWKRFREGAEWEDGVRFEGGVLLAATEAEAALFVQRAQALGRAASLASTSQVRKRTGLQAKLENGVFLEDEGIVDPGRVLSGLMMQARAHGVIIEFGADVAKVRAGVATTHDDREFEADFIVLAPGAWATEKLIAAAPALRHIRPAKGHMVEVLLSETLAPALHAPTFYLAQRREDVVLGATMEFNRYDRRIDPARVAELLAAAEALLPGEVKATGRAWTGIRPMSPDGWPMIGPAGEGLLVAAGHSRNGWLLAPITAEIITAYVFRGEIPADWAALSPERFDTP